MHAPPPHPSRSANGWSVWNSTGLAGPFHSATPHPDVPITPEVWVHRVHTPALVLGSTQSEELIDTATAAADGVEVCRRRSGGGLVYIDPATDCWIDLIIPPSSPWWDADLGRSFHRVGEQWAAVLSAFQPPEMTDRPVVHRSPDRPASRRFWCFAGVGHGEITIDGAKVVGLSQRRTRHWIRIQTIVAGSWPTERLRRYVTATDTTTGQELSNHDPGRVSAGLPPSFGSPAPDELATRFLATLPPP